MCVCAPMCVCVCVIRKPATVSTETRLLSISLGKLHAGWLSVDIDKVIHGAGSLSIPATGKDVFNHLPEYIGSA